MLSTSRNEGVPIVVLGLQSWVILVVWLQIWYNTMLSLGETATEEDHHPLVDHGGPYVGKMATSPLPSWGSPTASTGTKIEVAT